MGWVKVLGKTDPTRSMKTPSFRIAGFNLSPYNFSSCQFCNRNRADYNQIGFSKLNPNRWLRFSILKTEDIWLRFRFQPETELNRPCSPLPAMIPFPVWDGDRGWKEFSFEVQGRVGEWYWIRYRGRDNTP